MASLVLRVCVCVCVCVRVCVCVHFMAVRVVTFRKMADQNSRRPNIWACDITATKSYAQARSEEKVSVDQCKFEVK